MYIYVLLILGHLIYIKSFSICITEKIHVTFILDRRQQKLRSKLPNS